jgi:nitrate reductase cytochrome c-type subunit
MNGGHDLTEAFDSIMWIFAHGKAILLAVQHFNDRNSVVVPQLSSSLYFC